MGTTAESITQLMGDIGRFSAAVWPEFALRRYQLPAARAIVVAVQARRGETLCVVMARQSGKDELLAQVLSFLLVRAQFRGGEIVFATPSLHPQGDMSAARVMDRLHAAGPLARGVRERGDMVSLGKASIRYMSAGPSANARGATASLLTVGNEAQDIETQRWDAVFDPMGAATNSATVFSGTVWTDQTLLAREMARLQSAECRVPSAELMVHRREIEAHKAASTDSLGPRPSGLFMADWQTVAREVPAYGERVRARIAERGADDPFVRTEYMLLPLAGGGRLLDAGRLAQMRGEHPRIHTARAGRSYALLIDVGGGDAGDTLSASPLGGERDSTVCTVVDVESQAEGLPWYRVVDRRVWTGTGHLQLAQEIRDLARRLWQATYVVIDATGIGHGLAAMLAATLGQAVVPFIFTASSKSDLGWRFLSAVGAGRYCEYADDGAEDSRAFWTQATAATYTVRPGPGRFLQWGVPDAQTHDDLLLSAALVGALDDLDWSPRLAVGRVQVTSSE